MPLAPSPAVLRAAELLEHLTTRPGDRFTVSELARHTELPRATCDTLLLALAERGLVRRDADRRYSLGPACIVLGDAARVANPALAAADHEADDLGRALGAFTLVSIRDGAETRVASVFDHGPPLSMRARVGEAIELVAPFGASFVAWDDQAGIDRWLARAQPPLDPEEDRRYREALLAVRRRGFSVTVVTARQPNLIDALEHLAVDREPAEGRRRREEAVRQMTHSEYLATGVDAGATVRVAQVSAPVFDGHDEVAATIMLLGPTHEVTGAEVAELGRAVAAAADRATADVRGG